jgi:hypothetical protein
MNNFKYKKKPHTECRAIVIEAGFIQAKPIKQYRKDALTYQKLQGKNLYQVLYCDKVTIYSFFKYELFF